MYGEDEINNNELAQFGDKFEEPKYPKNANIMLLKELAWFFGGEGDFKKEKNSETWNDLLTRLQKAEQPRLATKKDLKVTDQEITNISNDPVLVVLGHQHYVNFALHIGKRRVHWLSTKGVIKNESGYKGMHLFWFYPNDVVQGKSFQTPAFLK